MAFYVAALPREHLERHDIDLDELQPILAAVEAGEIERAIELTPIELADKLSLAGSPDEWIEHVRNRVVRGGANHLICCPSTRSSWKRGRDEGSWVCRIRPGSSGSCTST